MPARRKESHVDKFENHHMTCFQTSSYTQRWQRGRLQQRAGQRVWEKTTTELRNCRVGRLLEEEQRYSKDKHLKLACLTTALHANPSSRQISVKNVPPFIKHSQRHCDSGKCWWLSPSLSPSDDYEWLIAWLFFLMSHCTKVTRCVYFNGSASKCL